MYALGLSPRQVTYRNITLHNLLSCQASSFLPAAVSYWLTKPQHQHPITNSTANTWPHVCRVNDIEPVQDTVLWMFRCLFFSWAVLSAFLCVFISHSERVPYTGRWHMQSCWASDRGPFSWQDKTKAAYDRVR